MADENLEKEEESVQVYKVIVQKINYYKLKLISQNILINKYEIEDEKKPMPAFKGKAFIEPWLVYLIVNLSALILLSALGLKIGMTISENYSSRLYGEHCNRDSECRTGMNYVCSEGVCKCSTNYLYVSTDAPCSKL